MATQKEVEATYDYMDEVFRLSLGNHADISGAMYNGDFSLTLERAQKAKHDYVFSNIHFKKGDRVLDIGCGWGPMLAAIREYGGRGIGLTLSPAQARACQADGLNAFVKDWKDIDPKEIGRVDGIVSIGAFEHFCSITEMQAGKQEEIYRHFFELCSHLLVSGGRMYLQTMMWGRRVPRYPEEFDVNAPKLSDRWILGHIIKFYPGSWLPDGLQQIQKCASPWFDLVSENNGRLDYIQTMKEWGQRASRLTVKKIVFALRLIPRFMANKEFRYQITSLRYSCNQRCFQREIMSHQRMVFEKR